LALAGLSGERALHHRQRFVQSPDLAQRLGMDGQKPPVVAVIGQQQRRVGQLRGLPPGLARHADEAEDVGADLCGKRVARERGDMCADGIPRFGGATRQSSPRKIATCAASRGLTGLLRAQPPGRSTHGRTGMSPSYMAARATADMGECKSGSASIAASKASRAPHVAARIWSTPAT
jgi:hypothetical protein